MDNKDVPYIVYEGSMARQERTIKRLWILAIILIVALVGTNAGWVYYESQWQYVDTTTSQEVTQDVDSGDGSATITGIGDVNNGESSTNGESIKQN
jgi:hypothetical protein